jgi:hypothetical protein
MELGSGHNTTGEQPVVTDLVRTVHVLIIQRPGQAKVSDLQLELVTDEQVCALDVAERAGREAGSPQTRQQRCGSTAAGARATAYR